VQTTDTTARKKDKAGSQEVCAPVVVADCGGRTILPPENSGAAFVVLTVPQVYPQSPASRQLAVVGVVLLATAVILSLDLQYSHRPCVL
jgi:hypothetical protein